MQDFLASPLPFATNWKQDILSIVAVGLFVALFLFVFQPFGTQEFESTYRGLFLSGYGIIISTVFCFFQFALPKIFTDAFGEENWTVAKQLIWLISVFLTTTTFWYLYWSWFFGEELVLSAWVRFALLSFSIFAFPVIALLGSRYIAQLRKERKAMRSVNQSLSAANSGEELESVLLSFGGEGDQELTLSAEQFLFLRAARNYVEVHYQQDGNGKQSLLRSSLKQIHARMQLPALVHCHRSFIVNLNQVEQVSYHSKQYRLHLRNSNHRVPLARSKVRSVLAYLNHQHP